MPLKRKREKNTKIWDKKLRKMGQKRNKKILNHRHKKARKKW